MKPAGHTILNLNNLGIFKKVTGKNNGKKAE